MPNVSKSNYPVFPESHYSIVDHGNGDIRESKHQPIEVMQENMTNEEFIGFLKGNILKYVCRCGKKDEPIREAEKIVRYANWLVDVLKGRTIDPRI